ncbi:hypothetical protein [Aliarcobacter skirrowii]|uniref:hypothetical protein n=1 Tax=Aliarcobacter skirrowii TaxID=28200 RepID=UPI00082A64F6|nr:hypothetical protein [Aliarcobacter skirrowii]
MFKKRKVDLFTLMILALFYYTSPLIFGYITLIGIIDEWIIKSYIYNIFIFTLICVLLSVVIYDYNTKNIVIKKYTEYSSMYYTHILFVFMLFMFFYGVHLIGFENYFVGTKQNVEEMNVFLGTAIWLLLMTLSLSFVYKRKIIFLISLLLLSSVLLFGSRSYFVTGILMLGILKYGDLNQRLITHYKPIILLVILISGLIVFKTIYPFLKTADFAFILERIMQIEFDKILSLFLADPMSVIYNMQLVLEYNIIVPDECSAYRYLSLIPSSRGVIENLNGIECVNFSQYLGEQFHADVPFGLASSVYAEVYAFWGGLGLGLFILLWCITLYYANLKLLIKSTFFLFLLPTIVYGTFYIHRIDLVFVTGALKKAIIMYIFIYIIIYLLPKRNKNLNREAICV